MNLIYLLFSDKCKKKADGNVYNDDSTECHEDTVYAGRQFLAVDFFFHSLCRKEMQNNKILYYLFDYLHYTPPYGLVNWNIPFLNRADYPRLAID